MTINPLTLCKKPKFKKEDFWLNDYKELYQDMKYLHFYPLRKMTRNEQLNAISRILIYFSLMIILFNKDYKWLYVSMIGLIIIVIIYNINKNDKDSKKKELKRILKLREEEKEKKKKELEYEMKHDGEEDYEEEYVEEKNYDLEAGFRDGDGNIIIGKENKVPKYEKEKPETLYKIDEIIEYKKNTCKKPTINNPLMNLNITDYNAGDKPVACNSNEEDISEEIRINYNKDLYENIEDLWDKKNSERQFYTTPNTAIPNNQKEFAEWLYKVPLTCKEDQTNCLRVDFLKNRR